MTNNPVEHTLYTKDSKDKIRFWKVFSDLIPNEEGHVTIIITHGVLDSDKIQTKERVAKPKNIGKANETTGTTQAIKDIEALITAQRDKGYVDNIDDYVEPFRPMLAHKYADRKHTITWGEVYGSSKLDGIRCFILVTEQGSVSFMSRTGKPFKNFDHIQREIVHSDWYKEHLKSNNSNDISVRYVLDGELFNEELDFPEISSRVNSDDYDETRDSVIQFHMYDFIDLKNKYQEFPDRLDAFWHSIEDGSGFKHIRLVDQVELDSEEDLMTLFSQHMRDGYEGTMVKSKNSYVFGKRSNTLLKYKEMITEEFEIVSVELSEQDSLKPKVILRSKNKNKDLFSTGTIKGDKEEVYQTYYVNRDSIIGKWMTIQYQTLSPYGVPLFPVGIAIREGEEVNGEFIPEV